MTTFVRAIVGDLARRLQFEPAVAGLTWRGRAAAARAHIFVLAIVFMVTAATPLAAVAQPSANSAPLRPGDLLVIREVPNALKKVDPVTGVETTLSDFLDPSQGPSIPPPVGTPGPKGISGPRASVAVESPTDVFVVHPFFGTDARAALFRVNPTTGVRSIISDFGDATQGPLLGRTGEEGRFDIGGLALERSGDFLFVALGLDTARLVRIDRSTGSRAILSDLSDPAQGPTVIPSFGLAVEESGSIMIGGSKAGGDGALFRVDPSSGVRTLFRDLGTDDVHTSRSVGDLAIDFSGNLMVKTSVTNGPPPFAGFHQLLRVDPMTGMSASVSSCPALMPGDSATVVNGLAVEDTGDIVVIVWAGRSPILNFLARINPVTGACAEYPTNIWDLDVAVVPTPLVNELVSVSVASAALEPSIEAPSAPAGVFRIAATFTNVTSTPIRKPFFRVAAISGGNLLVNGDRPPTVAALSGRGARLTPDVGSDGVLTPGESLEVVFDIGLQTREPFTFFVNVFGEAL